MAIWVYLKLKLDKKTNKKKLNFVKQELWFLGITKPRSHLHFGFYSCDNAQGDSIRLNLQLVSWGVFFKPGESLRHLF